LQMPNISSVSEFLLLAFADTQELQLLHFALFLGIYLAALLSNGLILTTIACNHCLHTPMYFFLFNLAPKSLNYSIVLWAFACWLFTTSLGIRKPSLAQELLKFAFSFTRHLFGWSLILCCSWRSPYIS
uniref:Uncharacterized protein n=1 Tax=Cairina moschata TaxID=8855 RepID=A0A8C3GPE8_CAIMO